MKNAKQELLDFVQSLVARKQLDIEINPIKCAIVNYYDAPTYLKVGYTKEDLEVFLEKINFMYDSGYGSQEVFGKIWFTDDSWATRGEYDGSEWWEHHYLPQIPAELLG